jgi:DNA repair protein RecO (recombination protein O)
MRETFDNDPRIRISGMIIKHRPVGEYDYICTILTMERGKVSAFARGARKPGGKLSGNVEPFCYGNFILYEGRNSYNLIEADIINYFEYFRRNLESSLYGSCFLELADYYATENSDESDLLKLLYISLVALCKGTFDNRLIRCVFELRALVIDGQYPGFPQGRGFDDAVRAAMQHIETAPLKELFAFRLNDEALRQLMQITDVYRNKYVDRRLNSAEMLDIII